MEAIILAGGLGTRLSAVISGIPKPMAPVASTPFLYYILDNLNEQGIDKVILTVHHMSEKIKNIGDKYRNIDISYLHESKPLGTGGAIKRALQYIQNDNALVLNGDTYFQINYKKMHDIQINSKSDMVIALRKVDDISRYSSVEIGSDGIVKEFKTHGDVGKPGLIGAGAYIVRKNLFRKYNFKRRKFSFESDFLSNLTENFKINSCMSDGYFIDIGVPEDYFRAQAEIPKIINEKTE